ncbi:MAG: LysR family transcriptional regulator, partial [Nocardioides sp.]
MIAASDLDFDDVVVFVRIVDLGGITAAADALHLPKSSVSRRLARLERRLGTRLLHRTTRSVTPTEAGRALHLRVAPALAEVRNAVAATYDAREIPRGTVRMSAPPDVGAEVLPTLVSTFVADHPQVRVTVDLSGAPIGHGGIGYDLALCDAPPTERGLIVTKLQDMCFRLYASPAYVERAGNPRSADDLAHHDCVLFRADNSRSRWILRHRQGSAAGPAIDVVVGGAVTANGISFVRRTAIAGAGIALLPHLAAAADVAEGRLMTVLDGYETESSPLFLTLPAQAHTPLAVRALRDHLLLT